MNAVLARLWLWFWHLLPANPILVRVVHGASRRKRHLWLRFAYLGIIAAVVLWLQLASAPRGNASLTELAKSASTTFQYAAATQMLLMCFLAPVFTASAITQERDAQTYNILISTPLTAGQIVLGSLMSRLYFVIMLLLAGLPIFFMSMIYGGVTTRQIFESFMLSAATAVVTGALAIFIAMIGVGTRRTIFSFYLTIALYLLAIFLLSRWDGTWVAASTPNVNGVQMSWLTPLHPFLALEVALHRVHAPDVESLTGYGAIARNAFAHPATTFVVWTLAASAAMVAASLYFVRSGIRAGEPTFLSTAFRFLRRTPASQRARAPRTVWSNPVAWREAHTRASGGRFFRRTIILGGAAATLAVLVAYLRGDLRSSEVPSWLAGLTIVQFALAAVIAANTAATSITREKESKTVELLLTTPLTSSYILWGKLRGLVSFALPLLLGPVIALVGFAIIDLLRGVAPPAIRIETAFQVALLLLVYIAVACVIGLRFSLTSRTNMTAVMSSVGAIILGGGLLTLIGVPLIDSSGGEFGAFIAPFTPLTAVWCLIDPDAMSPGLTRAAPAAASSMRFSASVGCALALALYAFIVWRGYTALVRGFDMTMRKQSAG